jgi:hypothetical protein
VVVHERYDTRQLRDHEQAEEAGTQAADGSSEWRHSRRSFELPSHSKQPCVRCLR